MEINLLCLRTDGTLEPYKVQEDDFRAWKAYANMETAEHARTTIDWLHMLLDEEGKLLHKPINYMATLIYPHKDVDFIVGDVILCKINDQGDDLTGFTDQEIDKAYAELIDVFLTSMV